MKMKFYILELFLSGDEAFQNNFLQKKKIFEMKYILKIFSEFRKVPKCKISFFYPLSLDGKKSFPAWKRESSNL